MNIGKHETAESAVNAMLLLKRSAPYRFGGAWHVAAIGGEGFAFRTREPLLKRWRAMDPRPESLQTFRVST